MANYPSIPTLMADMNALERAVSDFETGLSSTTATKTGQGGKVVAVANGNGRLVSLSIDDSLIASSTAVSLASAVKTVANEAIVAAIATASSAAVSFAQALALPGLPAYGAGTPSYPGFAATASLTSSTALANNPCQKPRTFVCRSGAVEATLDGERHIVGLVFDEPLTEDAEDLAGNIVAAVNCAVGKATNPPEDVHDGVGGIVDTNVSYEQLVLYANDCLEVAGASTIRDVGCVGVGKIANAGTGTVKVSSASITGSIVSRGNVIIESAAVVHGSIRSEGTVTVWPLGIVDGPIEQNKAVLLPLLRVGVVFPPTAQNGINLFPATTASASPAYYRSMNLGLASTLNLSAGVYYTDTLSLEATSRIVVDATNGPVILWVKNSINFCGTFQDKNGDFPRIWVGYTGTQEVLLVSPYCGSLVAPNAKVTLAAPPLLQHTGSFHAKTLCVAYGQTVCHRPFELPFNQIPGARPPEPPLQPIAPATKEVLGFEVAPAWSSSKATLALVTTPITQGAKALRVTNIALGNSPINSRVFSAVGLYAPGGQVLLDVYIPAALGSIGIQAKIPSAGINTPVSFGTRSLIGLPTARYSTLSFSIPATVAAAIVNGATDVTLSIVFNVSLSLGAFYVDNLRFE